MHEYDLLTSISQKQLISSQLHISPNSFVFIHAYKNKKKEHKILEQPCKESIFSNI